MSQLTAWFAALVVIGCGVAGAARVPVARREHTAAPAPAPRTPPRLQRHRTAHRLGWRAQRRRERALDRTFPDLLDLFVVAVQAGQLPLAAVDDLRSYTHPIVAEGLDEVIARVDRGDRFVDALDCLVDAWGPRALTFVATVGATERTGLPLAPALERIADDARRHRRHGAEAAARELPVRLSFPLVLCTLPAFVLVAIVPLLVGALSSLGST